jgi:hypothetical protein
MDEIFTQGKTGPWHRALIGVDIEASTGRPDAEKLLIRSALYDIIEGASHATGITEANREPYEDRGDGLIMLVRPENEVPKNVLLSIFVPEVKRLLTEHNKAHPALAFRIRLAVHAGEVSDDGRGWCGQAFDLTCRLLNAPRVKQYLRKTSDPIMLVVSDDIYRSVVSHGYEGIDKSRFQPGVKVKIGHRWHQGWVLMAEQVLAG